MFSKMIEELRLEAEAVSASNYSMLAEEYIKRQNRAPHTNSPNKLQASGLALGSGGVVGIMALAVANQAAAFGSAGVLASASTALAGLGTVAIGTAVLPFATVVVVGAALIGVATLGIGTMAKGLSSSLMSKADTDNSKLSRAIRNGDGETLKKIGSENLDAGAWLSGAKRLLVKSLRESVIDRDQFRPKSAALEKHDRSDASGGRNANHAVAAYELEDLLGTPEDKQVIVENIGKKIWDKHGVVVSDESIHECLAEARDNASFSGVILEVDQENGLVIQSLGRGRATVHNLKDFAQLPEVGKNAEIAFKGGLMQGAGVGQARDGGRSVER